MASPGTQTIFDEISQQIYDTFRGLIDQLTARMEQLLEEVRKRKEEFEQSLNSQRESLNNLEDIRVRIEQMSANQTNQLQSSLAPIQKQIKDAKTGLVQLPKLKFEYVIPPQFENLGAIIIDGSIIIDYSRKIKASHAFGEQGNYNGQFNSLKSLHIDGEDLYVVDGSRVQIFGTLKWDFKRNILLDQDFKPNVVTTNKDFVYIAGFAVAEFLIYKFRKQDYAAVKGKQKVPFQYSKWYCDHLDSLILLKDEIFVAHCEFETIHIFDLDLQYRKYIKLPNFPKCIQFRENRLCVLDKQNSLQIFTIDGQPVGSSHEFRPKEFNSFCFDSSGYAILVSKSSSQIHVVKPSGDEIYAIGKGTEYSEDISGCNSVAVYRDQLIVTCPKWNCVKII